MNKNDFDVLSKLKLIFTYPSDFFEKHSRGDSISGSIILFLFVSIIAASISFTISSYRSNILFFPGGVVYASSLRNSILQPFLALACIFVYAFISCLFSRMFGGFGGYKHSINVMAYSFIPNAIFSGLPPLPAGIGLGIGGLAFMYSIYLGVIGISTAHGIPGRPAFISYIAPCLVFLIGVILLYSFLYGTSSLF